MKFLLALPVIAGIIFSSCGTNHVKEPEYRDIRNVRLIELGPIQSTAGVDLVFYNPNSFGVQVATGSGDIYIDSMFFGKFELSDKVRVSKRSEFTLPALVKIDMIGLIRNHDIFKKKEALVRLEGTATIKKSGFSKEIPIKYERTEDIEKFRALISH